MARKKASHPPPPSPRKLRNVIEAGMMNIENIPKDTDMDFDPTEHGNYLTTLMICPIYLKQWRIILKNPKWESIDSAILNGDWLVFMATIGRSGFNDYLVWLSEGQVKSGDHYQSSWMTMVSNLHEAITAKTTYRKIHY